MLTILHIITQVRNSDCFLWPAGRGSSRSMSSWRRSTGCSRRPSTCARGSSRRSVREERTRPARARPTRRRCCPPRSHFHWPTPTHLSLLTCLVVTRPLLPFESPFPRSHSYCTFGDVLRLVFIYSTLQYCYSTVHFRPLSSGRHVRRVLLSIVECSCCWRRNVRALSGKQWNERLRSFHWCSHAFTGRPVIRTSAVYSTCTVLFTWVCVRVQSVLRSLDSCGYNLILKQISFSIGTRISNDECANVFVQCADASVLVVYEYSFN